MHRDTFQGPHWMEHRVGPRAGPDVAGKREVLPCRVPNPVVQPAACSNIGLLCSRKPIALSALNYRVPHLRTVTYCGINVKPEGSPLSAVTDCLSQPPPGDTCAKVTLVARPLVTSVAQQPCSYGLGVLTNRTCVESRKLHRIEIVCCC
jgi:hypothetical protein